MANNIKDFRLTLAASLYMSPCTELELIKRFNHYSVSGVQRQIMELEKDALYYEGEQMFIKRLWAKNNLKEYDLDTRTEKQKELDGLSELGKALKKKGLI